MGRSLIWLQGDAEAGWACSSCRWRFPVPTLLTGDEAKDAYDRIAAAKFRTHKCESETSIPSVKENVDQTFANRARMLVKQGYKPKDAVDLTLQETAIEYRNDPKVMQKAQVDADEFLLKLRKGLI